MVTNQQSMKAVNGAEVLEREHTRRGPWFRPDIDIYETQDEIVLLADIPGATTEGVDLRFENGMLTLHARVEPRYQQGADFLIREYDVGDYYRVFQVTEEIDPSRISAEIFDGVLTLHLPKTEATKPRRIQVQSSDQQRAMGQQQGQPQIQSRQQPQQSSQQQFQQQGRMQSQGQPQGQAQRPGQPESPNVTQTQSGGPSQAGMPPQGQPQSQPQGRSGTQGRGQPRP